VNMIRFVILLSTFPRIHVYCQTISNSAIACHRLRQKPASTIRLPTAALPSTTRKQDETT
jgi:hypothetical protein